MKIVRKLKQFKTLNLQRKQTPRLIFIKLTWERWEFQEKWRTITLNKTFFSILIAK